MPISLRPSFAVIALLSAGLAPSFAAAQTKIEALVRQLKAGELVRVIILTRPEAGAGDSSMAPAKPAEYLAGTLGSSASNVKALGRLPGVSAEISKEALPSLYDDPNVSLVSRHL